MGKRKNPTRPEEQKIYILCEFIFVVCFIIGVFVLGLVITTGIITTSWSGDFVIAEPSEQGHSCKGGVLNSEEVFYLSDYTQTDYYCAESDFTVDYISGNASVKITCFDGYQLKFQLEVNESNPHEIIHSKGLDCKFIELGYDKNINFKVMPIQEKQPVRECVEWKDVNYVIHGVMTDCSICGYERDGDFFNAIYSEKEKSFCSRYLNVALFDSVMTKEEFKEKCENGDYFSQLNFDYKMMFIKITDEKQTEKLCACWSDEDCAKESEEK